MTLAELQTETGSIINWVEQLSYLFNMAGVTANTRIVVQRREYFRNMTALLASLPEANRNRMLHNYLIWRVAEMYVQV